MYPGRCVLLAWYTSWCLYWGLHWRQIWSHQHDRRRGRLGRRWGLPAMLRTEFYMDDLRYVIVFRSVS